MASYGTLLAILREVEAMEFLGTTAKSFPIVRKGGQGYGEGPQVQQKRLFQDNRDRYSGRGTGCAFFRCPRAGATGSCRQGRSMGPGEGQRALSHSTL